MGFRPPADVPDTFVVTDYNNVQPVWHPLEGTGFEGSRRNIGVQELIQAEGRRTPDSTVAQRRYRFGFILVTPAGQPVAPEDVQQVETYRRQFEDVGLATEAERAAAGDVSDALLDAIALRGEAATASSRLQAYRDAGADLPVVYPVATLEPVSSILGTLFALAPAPAVEG